MVSLARANRVGLQLPIWAVLAAIVLTQISVGRSLKATIDYLAGTIGAAIYGCAVGLLVGHDSEAALLAGLAIAVGPLALVAAALHRIQDGAR